VNLWETFGELKTGKGTTFIQQDDSSTTRFIRGRNRASEVNAMVSPMVGLAFLTLIVRSALGIVVVIALVWLVFKLGRLMDAYTKKLQAK